MTGQKILIIDNDDDILQILNYILAEEGYQVTMAADLPPLAEIEQQPPALILLDHWLSERSGETICKLLKLNPKTSHIPVILISATQDLEQTSARCFANAFLPKPFDIDTLLNLVKRFIRSIDYNMIRNGAPFYLCIVI